jgi:hypothetical protein
METGRAHRGAALGNPLLQAEGRVTLVDGIPATAVLVALALKAVIGWWWADPLPGMCSSSTPPGRHVRSSPALTNAINKMANATRPGGRLAYLYWQNHRKQSADSERLGNRTGWAGVGTEILLIWTAR